MPSIVAENEKSVFLQIKQVSIPKTGVFVVMRISD